MKIVAKCVIEVEDKINLEKSWFSYSAINDLIKRDITNNVILDKYQIVYAEYNKQWAYILNKYFDKDYTTGNYKWNCDFNTNIVEISL